MEKDFRSFSVSLFAFIFVLSCISLASAEIRINEVELNPPGSSDNGNEWIELYSSDEVNMEDWKIESSNGRNITFNASFSGYHVIIGNYNLLTDKNNSLTLKDSSGNTIFSTSALKDTANDARTWQYCSGEWIFIEDTKNAENNCTEELEEDQKEEKEEEEDNETVNQEESEDEEELEENQEEEEDNEEKSSVAVSGKEKTPETIVLGESEDIKSSNNVLYKSKTSTIKDWMLIIFGAVCVIVIILLLIDRRKSRGID